MQDQNPNTNQNGEQQYQQPNQQYQQPNQQYQNPNQGYQQYQAPNQQYQQQYQNPNQQYQNPNQQYQPPYGQPPYGQPPYGQPQKSKLVAGLLGIFLGGFGVHNFYLGFTTRAVIQIVVSLVTCGIGAWWGIIEGILILCGRYTTVDAN
ncbi:MAG TPA: TM2 domain-containing protein, partial [Firmicutes bacterium]|nr:TM2 domain-containing protein [Bacillota bacterium]